jgi:hypothetical protein
MSDRASDREPPPPEPVDVGAPTDDVQPGRDSPFPRPILDQVVAHDTPFGRPDLSDGYPLEKDERDSLREAIRELESDSRGSDEADPPREHRLDDE